MDKMEKKWYYDAFISYRHTEIDSFVAKNLHRQLESFKLPGNVARRLKENGEEAKTRITRVFRDQEELPLVSNLADPIMEALDNSEFLIVICSPRLKESMWCKKEIETFISLRGREHVLLVLAEGEPSDSFPEELLYREETETLDDGSAKVRRVPAEPLAADVRGKSNKEIRNKIKSEILRLAAPMFGCGYDDLKQRHREQKMRKIIAVSLAGSLFCMLFGLVCMTMALRIRRQNVQIIEQSEEIALQAEEIEKQYEEALRNSCISQARESFNLLDKGDRIAAIETAMKAFPGGENEDIPYTPQASYALSKSLNLYENNKKILPDRILEADTNIRFMKISQEGGRIITVDDFGMLCVWNAEDGKKLASFLLSSVPYRQEASIAFVNEDEFLYPTEEGISCFNISSETDVYSIDCERAYEICYFKETDKAVVTTGEGFLVISGQSGELAVSGSIPQSEETENPMEISDGAVINEEGTLFAVAAESKEEAAVFVYDIQTGEVYRRYNITNGLIECMRFEDDVLYVADNDRWEIGSSFFDDLGGTVYACDLSQDDIFLWTYRSDSDYFYRISASSKEESDYIVCTSYDDIFVLDRENGGLIKSISLGSEIVEIRNYIGQDAFMVFTRDGVLHYVNISTMTDIVSTAFSNCNSANVKAFGIGDGYYVTLPYLNKSITLYRLAMGNNYEILCESENRYDCAVLSQEGRYLAVRSYADAFNTCIEMIDTDTGEALWNYTDDEYFEGMSFYPEMAALTVITGDGIVLLDNATGEQKAFYEKDTISGYYMGSDTTGRYAAILENRSLNVYDVADGSLAYEIVREETAYDSGAVAISPAFRYLAAVPETTDSLKLYDMTELRGGRHECLYEIKDINATYVENIFFNDRDECESGLTLYVVYKNGDIKRYGVDVQNHELFEDNGLQDLTNCMMRFIQPEGTDYSIIAGDFDAYLIHNAWYNPRTDDGKDVCEVPESADFTGHGEIAAHIEGFLAADGKRNCIYLTDGSCIYRVQVYDNKALREEAERQLDVKK